MTSQQQVVHFFLCLSLASLTPTRATYKDCYKTKYITATHESFVNLNIHEDPDCKQCPDGSVEIARVDLIPGNYYKDVMIYWNKENIFIKVPEHSVLMSLSIEEPAVEMNAHYTCILPDAQIVNVLKINITFRSVELVLTLREDHIIEDTPLHVTCTLEGHIENAEFNITIAHKNNTLMHCPENPCVYNTTRADLVNDGGYYFCKASIEDKSIKMHHHCESSDLYVNITRDKKKQRVYLGITIGVPIGTSVLIVVATVIIATIVLRRRGIVPPYDDNEDDDDEDDVQHRGYRHYGATGNQVEQRCLLRLSNRSSDVEVHSLRSTPSSEHTTPLLSGASESETALDGYTSDESNKSKSSKESANSKHDDSVSLPPGKDEDSGQV